MKKWICILISKLTFNKVCLKWCEVKTPNVVEEIKPAPKKKAKPAPKKKANKKVTITPQMKKSFVKDRKNGLSFKAIGEKHGIPTSTVTYHVKNSK
jgi:hypothetical protein